jgi:hypothetical protein
MAGGDCQQLALTPDFTPHDPLYGSSLAYELCTIVRNSKSHDSRSGRSSKTEGKGADNSRGSAGADPRRALSLELGDRVQSGMYGIRCFNVLDAIGNILIWHCQPWYCSYLQLRSADLTIVEDRIAVRDLLCNVPVVTFQRGNA